MKAPTNAIVMILHNVWGTVQIPVLNRIGLQVGLHCDDNKCTLITVMPPVSLHMVEIHNPQFNIGSAQS